MIAMMSDIFAPRIFIAISALNFTRCAVPLSGSTRIGSTPQLSASLRQASLVEQRAKIGILGRWHATRRGVPPEEVAAMIAFAETDFAIE